MKLRYVILIYSVFNFHNFCQARLRPTDLTLNSESVGEDVVNAVIEKIRFYMEEPSDFDLLKRIANVETDYGRKKSASATNSKGGIWQISIAIHNSLMLYESYSNISMLVEKIRSSFPLPCVLCGNMDYTTPMHSGLAAYVYIKMKLSNVDVPISVEDQARWWAQQYHQGGGIALDYIDAVLKSDDEQNCIENLKMDLWILADGSDSVSSQEFDTVKDFSTDLKAAFDTSSSVRFGWSQFSISHNTVFKLSDPQDDFNSTVSGTNKLLGSAETGFALNSVRKMLEDEKRKDQLLALTVLLVIINGNGDDDLTEATQLLHQTNILTFAVGVGDVDQTRLQTIASTPSFMYSYTFSQYKQLTSGFVQELTRVFCKAPVPLQDSKPPLSASIRPGRNQYVLLVLGSNKSVSLNISTGIEGAGNLVYGSVISPNPNPAFYDFQFHLHKGSVETDMKHRAFITTYESVSFPTEMPLYLRISGSENGIVNTQLSSKSFDSDQQLPPAQKASTTVLIIMLVAIALTGLSGTAFFAIRFYLNSTYYKKRLYEKESHRNMKDVLHTLSAIQKMTDEAKLPYANLQSLNKLEDHLNIAEEMEIPKDRLTDSYNALSHLKKTIEMLRENLIMVTMEGKQPSANYQTMARLENLIHQGKNYDFSEAEMKQPLIVFNKLKERIDPVSRNLALYTQKAKCPTATVTDMKELEQYIQKATALSFPPATIYDACDALEHLQDRVLNVEKKIIKLTEEAGRVESDPELAETLDEELVLAEVLHISDDVVKPAKQALRHLRSSTDTVKQELLQEIEEARQPTATLKTIEKLRSSIMIAEQYNISVNFLKEPRDALKMLEDRLEEIKRLMKAAADEAKNPDAGFFELAKLENMLCLAEKSNFSENDLTPFRQVFNELQTKLNPIIEGLKKVCDEAKLSTANIETMRELQEKINHSMKFRIGFDKLEEPRRLLRFLHKIDESIVEAKKELEDALKLCELYILTPMLNVVRNNQKQMLAWNPNDKHFKVILQRAINSEKAMLQELEAKYRAKLDKLNPKEKLEVLIDERDLNRFELRTARDEFQKFCGDKATEDDKELIKKATDVFVNKTINYAVNILNAAIPSHLPKTVSAALEKAESILKQDIPEANAQSDPRIVAACKKAEDVLASAYVLEKNETEKLNAYKDELKKEIKLAMEGDIDKLRHAIKTFVNDVGFSHTNEENELLDEARKVIAGRIKENLMKQFQNGLKTRNNNDLKDALTSLDAALMQELRQHDVDEDSALDSVIKTARSLYFNMLELDRTVETINSLKEGAIGEVFKNDNPSPNIANVIKAIFLILGFQITEKDTWTKLKPIFTELGENGLKKKISEQKVADVKDETVKQSNLFIKDIATKDVEAFDPVVSALHGWVSCVLKQLKK